ncbi:hypothetical protein ACQKLP_21895 [Chitinophaga sp. NPDC101104]|uniref:hypothetical protein n=1 Tax=Chitinophaga sp. NPDC101104 TaxID=3390561 RepID=UPI003D0441BA
MKRLLTILAVFISAVAQAQNETPWNYNAVNNAYDGLWPRGYFLLTRDTTRKNIMDENFNPVGDSGQLGYWHNRPWWRDNLGIWREFATLVDLSAYMKYSDSASMLIPYLRKADLPQFGISNQFSAAQNASFWISGQGRVDNAFRIATSTLPAAPLQVGTLPSYANLSIVAEGNIQTVPAIANEQAVTLGQMKDSLFGKAASVGELVLFGPPTKLVHVADTLRGGWFQWQASGIVDNGITFAGSSGYWRRIFDRRNVFVDWFGTFRDGTTDDLPAIQGAINAAHLNGYPNVHLSAFPYAISDDIVMRNGVNLIGAGIDKTVIVALPSTGTPPPVGAPDTWAIYGEGTVTQLPNLASNANPLDTSLALASSATVTQNDLIMIGDTTSFSYSAYRNYYRQGEYFFTTKSTTGTTIYSQNGLNGSYPTASTTVYKVTPITGSISDLTIDGKTYTIGIGIKHGMNYTIRNVKSINGNRGNINYYHCINSAIQDCYAVQLTQQVNPYGIVVANSQNIVVERNYAYGQSHGLTVGGIDSYPLVNRGIRVLNNTFLDSTTNGGRAIDFHGNVENSSIVNNTSYGAISTGGANNTISDNTVIMGSTKSYGVLLFEVRETSFNIKGNTFIFTGPVYETLGSGLAYSGSGSEKVGGEIRITGNKYLYRASTGSLTNTIYVALGSATTNTNVVIDGNTVIHPPTTQAHVGIIALGTSGSARFNNVKVTNNVLRYAGTRVDFSRHVQVRGNTIDSTNVHALYANRNGSLDISDNHAEGYGVAGGFNTAYFIINNGRVWFNGNNGGSTAASHAYKAYFTSDTALHIGINNIYGASNGTYNISGSYTAQNNSFPVGNLGIGIEAPVSTLDVNGSVSNAIATVTGNTTMTAAQHTLLVNNSGSVTITLPPAAGCRGRVYEVKKISAASNDVIIDGDGSETIDGATTKTLTLQWSSIRFRSNGTAWFIISSYASATTL